MSYESQSGTEAQSGEVPNSGRPNKVRKTGYVVVISDDEGHIQDTPFATFDRGLAEEVALEYARELMWREWFYDVHGSNRVQNGWISAIYEYKLTDYFIEVKEIPWYG